MKKENGHDGTTVEENTKQQNPIDLVEVVSYESKEKHVTQAIGKLEDENGDNVFQPIENGFKDEQNMRLKKRVKLRLMKRKIIAEFKVWSKRKNKKFEELIRKKN